MPIALPLEGPRLRLRGWTDADLGPLAAINGDPTVMRHFPATMTRAESDAWAARIRAHHAREGFGLWVVERRDAPGLVGVVGLMRIPWYAYFTPAVEIGWRIAPAHWGQGLATEAARLALDAGFGPLGLREVVAFTVPANAASLGVIRRLGMRPDASFQHPNLPATHPLRTHLLFRASAGDRAG